ncbi:ficolin-2-like [Mytilus trossulus]|uniref:ficolin-2-like n=1 Tax=Mytilus trossulus TaxID=6551 RepID=UPI00300446C5
MIGIHHIFDMVHTGIFQENADCSSLPPDSCSGVYTIQTDTGMNIDVFCEMDIDKGGWTVIQRRFDGSIDFFRYWHDYKTGFGDVAGEHWLGNDHIYAITQQRSYKARFDLEDFEGRTRYAIYTTFSIGNGGTNYTLSLKGYSGNAGDAIKPERTKARINGMMFSTRDRDNDPHMTKHCAVKNQGGWWFNQCTQANINGIYGMNVTDETNINWKTWQDDTPLKQTRMMIKSN